MPVLSAAAYRDFPEADRRYRCLWPLLLTFALFLLFPKHQVLVKGDDALDAKTMLAGESQALPSAAVSPKSVCLDENAFSCLHLDGVISEGWFFSAAHVVEAVLSIPVYVSQRYFSPDLKPPALF